MSDPVSVTGGAVQGSILGLLDHNAVLENIDSNFSQASNKYVDDMTLEEHTSKSSPSVVDFDDDAGRERHTFHAISTQRTLARLEEQCEVKGLKLNEKKTQLLSVSAGRVLARSWIEAKDGNTIYSTPECKILGFIFSSKPNVEAQVANLIRKANTRTFVIRHYSTFMHGKDLVLLYSSLARSILEYSSVTYGPLLSKGRSNQLEQVQKRCLKVTYVRIRQRLYNSPLFTIRRLLNGTSPEPPDDTADIDLSHLFNDPS